MLRILCSSFDFLKCLMIGFLSPLLDPRALTSCPAPPTASLPHHFPKGKREKSKLCPSNYGVLRVRDTVRREKAPHSTNLTRPAHLLFN